MYSSCLRSLRLYLNHLLLQMSHWLAYAPYFRRKNAKKESALLLPSQIYARALILYMYLHTHSSSCLFKMFFFSPHMMRPRSALNFEGMGRGRHRSNTMKPFYLPLHLFLTRSAVSHPVREEQACGGKLAAAKTLSFIFFYYSVWFLRCAG